MSFFRLVHKPRQDTVNEALIDFLSKDVIVSVVFLYIADEDNVDLQKGVAPALMLRIIADKPLFESLIDHIKGNATAHFWLLEKATRCEPDPHLSKLHGGQYVIELCKAHSSFKDKILQNADQLVRDTFLTTEQIEAVRAIRSEAEEVKATPGWINWR